MGLIQQLDNSISSVVNSGGTLGSAIRAAAPAGLALLLQDDVEAYTITLQLVTTGTPAMAQSFTFPVMPESLMMAQRYLMTVTTTLGGNYVDDFGRSPSQITLSGTFGKKVRASGVSGSLGSWRGRAELIKSAGSGETTGYGMAKRLSTLVEQSHTPQSDSFIPKLLFFNWAFNSHWEVVVDALDIKMDVSQNGLWMYQLTMRTLQPVKLSLGQRIDGIVAGAIQGMLNGALDDSVGSLVAGTVLNKVASVTGVTKALSKLGL